MINDGNCSRETAPNGNQPSGSVADGNEPEQPCHRSESSGRAVDRRQFLRATGAGAGVALLAGCTSGKGSKQDSNGSGSIDGPIKIGVLAPSPDKNPIGASIANGAKLAAKQLNDDGGVKGNDVKVVVKDTKQDPSTGKQKYQELLMSENVDATTGVFTSEVLVNILDDIAQQKKVHITAGAATPEASKRVHENYDKYKYHFRAGPLNAYQLGVNMVDFGKAKFSDMGWKSVAVLVEDYEWTKPVSQALDDRLSETNVEIKMRKRYASGTENFTPIFDQVESSGADAVFVAMAHTGTPAVVQWAKQQRPFEFGGIHVPMQLPSYSEATKGACQYGVTQNSATPTSKVTKKTVPFSNAYNDEYDSYPVYTGYIAYDAVNQYIDVVKKAGSTDSDTVVKKLEGSSYRGTAGTLEYYGKDNKYAHDVKYGKDLVWPVYQQWQGGKQEVIFPDKLATAEYQKPSWI